MSFDLSFHHRKAGIQLDPVEVSTYFGSLGHFKSEKFIGNTQHSYQNDDSGVYFSFEHFDAVHDEDEGAGAGEDEDQELPNGSGLSFGINYSRPSFFGLEAFPVVEKVARRFDLLVHDSQSELVLVEPRWESLFASWDKSNQGVSKALSGETGGAAYLLDRTKSQDAWKYNLARESMQAACKEDVFFPTMWFLHRSGVSKVQTAVTWKPALPQVIPVCDLIMTAHVKKGLLGRLKESSIDGVVPYPVLMEKLAPRMKAFEGPTSGMRILPESSGSSTLPLWIGLPLEALSDYEKLTPDQLNDSD